MGICFGCVRHNRIGSNQTLQRKDLLPAHRVNFHVCHFSPRREKWRLVWSGHSCPLPLTLAFALDLSIAPNSKELLLPQAAPWKSGASAPRKALGGAALQRCDNWPTLNFGFSR
jgi:hypothetical protein